MPHGRASYTPVVALDYAAKQLTFTARLGDGNGTNHVAYVKVSCKDCGHRGSAILLFEAIGRSEDGNYVSGVVPFPPLTERLEVCAAVVYSLECVTYNLVDLLVAEMEATYPRVKAVTVFWRLAGKVGSVTPSSSTLTIRREDPTAYHTAQQHRTTFTSGRSSLMRRCWRTARRQDADRDGRRRRG